MTAKHFLAAFLGALAIFFWGFVAHMFTPLGEAGITLLPGADGVSSALTSSIGDKPGMYTFPTGGLGPDATTKDKRDAMERMMEEMKTKPSGLLVYKPVGTTFNFPQALGVEFGINFLETLLIVYLLAQTGLATFGSRVLFVSVAGLLASVATNLSYWNWYGFNATYTGANILMEVIGFLCAGIVVALVIKNTPANQRA